VLNVRRILVACVVAALSLVIAACGALSPGFALTSQQCAMPVRAPEGAVPMTPGASTPVWSAEDGRPTVVVGDTAYGTAKGRCIAAVDVATGNVAWSVTPPSDHPSLFAVIADPSIVLASSGAPAGNGPGLDAPVVDGLVAYDAATGAAMWEVALPDDGQGMPALLTGSVVVVTQADGSVDGLSESDGHQLWKDPAPKGCSTSDTQDGTEPNAAMVGTASDDGSVTAVVGYACPAGGGVAAIDPSNGTARWRWQIPTGWDLEPQMAATVDTGSSSGTVVAATISLIPPANAPAIVAQPPGPEIPTQIPNVYNYAQTSDVVVLDPGTGRPLWDLTDVVGDLVTAGGAGTFCVLTDAGADCRDAHTGEARWSRTWPGNNAGPAAPALNCIDESVGATSCVVSANGLLYIALASPSAPAYPPGPGPATAADAFQITALNMTTGTTTATIPLPSFNNTQSDHAVSLEVPPAVLAVGDGMVLVSPQFEETDDVQAFADQGSG
jgi:outer membrane protein assembly factor BamB